MKTGLTNREVVLTIKHSIADLGPLSDESSFTNRELYFLLLRYRAAILAQKIRDRGFTLSKHNYQTILVPVDRVTGSESVFEEDKEYSKTRYPIPKPIGEYISVTSPGNHTNYQYIQWDAIQDLRNSRFKSERDKPRYTIKVDRDGAYLYLYNDKHSETVAVTGIFENPLEIQNFPDCDTGKINPCFSPLDEEFIIDPELLPVIYDMLLMSKFKFKPPTKDNLNNDNDDTINDKQTIK
jgi:hypothetical protein